ncbi:hypothetical protein JF550_02420 [Microbacterium esteraromaticum]|uniref:Gfo/Idh/MocA family oxidoreductase n=1 Tax=Microbacterium esteraromaticum TaxID=57043 RepID=A0A939DVG6_9MICO|nr:hypothetical protein [Microbacterium esteraromaticum]MBN8204808.1 hypothetical protein [Microbacterium esteraromaticum]MBN8414962.1 hypothetical protein [Microbacterium esteraromaticum]
MTVRPLRVGFAGLAHSHPYTDAANALAEGAEMIAVYDADPGAAAGFAERFGGRVVATGAELLAQRPDVVIATPRPAETVPFLRELASADARMPVFVNKVVAATEAQFAAWERALVDVCAPVGTASVLRFAPALQRLARDLDGAEVLGIRVHVQHDNTGFQRGNRAWQDDPSCGGGTVVTVGVHAWEMIDVLLPGAMLGEASGWTRCASGSPTRSEDAAGVNGVVRPAIGGPTVPVQATITGVPGPDRYAVEVLTSAGVRELELDVDQANEHLGFAGLVRALLADAPAGRVPMPWVQSRVVVANTIRAAAAARIGCA